MGNPASLTGRYKSLTFSSEDAEPKECKQRIFKCAPVLPHKSQPAGAFPTPWRTAVVRPLCAFSLSIILLIQSDCPPSQWNPTRRHKSHARAPTPPDFSRYNTEFDPRSRRESSPSASRPAVGAQLCAAVAKDNRAAPNSIHQANAPSAVTMSRIVYVLRIQIVNVFVSLQRINMTSAEREKQSPKGPAIPLVANSTWWWLRCWWWPNVLHRFRQGPPISRERVNSTWLRFYAMQLLLAVIVCSGTCPVLWKQKAK